MRDGPAQNLDTEAGRVPKVQRGGCFWDQSRGVLPAFSTGTEPCFYGQKVLTLSFQRIHCIRKRHATDVSKNEAIRARRKAS